MLAVVSSPTAVGQNFSGSLPYFCTTPQEVTMKRPNTGVCDWAQADRSGRLSKNGRPTATVPAPRKNARRLMVALPDLFIAHLHER
jgi:hypothetical protein